MGVGVEVLPGAAPGRVVLEVLLVLDLPAQVDEVRLAVAVWVDPDGAPGVEGGEVERDAVEVLVPAQGQGEGVRARVGLGLGLGLGSGLGLGFGLGFGLGLGSVGVLVLAALVDDHRVVRCDARADGGLVRVRARVRVRMRVRARG